MRRLKDGNGEGDGNEDKDDKPRRRSERADLRNALLNCYGGGVYGDAPHIHRLPVYFGLDKQKEQEIRQWLEEDEIAMGCERKVPVNISLLIYLSPSLFPHFLLHSLNRFKKLPRCIPLQP